MTDHIPCSECDYAHAVSFPDGSIRIVRAGQILQLDKEQMYLFEREGATPVMFGAFTEYTGGNLGKLATCICEKYPDVDEVKVLVEGRWRPLRLNSPEILPDVV